MKTNEAYAALAYRKTILKHTIAHLKRNLIGLDTEPKETLICEEVFQADSNVPVEEVVEFVDELIEEEEELRLEMDKFAFTRKPDEEKQSRKARRRRRSQTTRSKDSSAQG